MIRNVYDHMVINEQIEQQRALAAGVRYPVQNHE